ncbi:CPBP family intramembrane glutamic endopeptidase [Algoriphagus sp. SE2]|uniref:CPBP family intramembrane glutamic endopeptidase n=1 Tax=Algoriphagus sp. SE2 TaxID=3141536 RepID=UPI0031CCFEF2
METTNKTFKITLISALLLIFVGFPIPGLVGTKLVEAGMLKSHWQSVVQGIIFCSLIIPTIFIIRKRIPNAFSINLGIGDLKKVIPQFMKGAAIVFVPFVLTMTLSLLMGWSDFIINFNTNVILGLLIGFLAVIIYEALPEELLFRGYLLGILHSKMSKWAAIITNIALFVISPLVIVTIQSDLLGMNINIGGADSITLGYMINMLLFACFTIFLRQISGSIWMGVGFHCFFVYQNYFIGTTEHSLFQLTSNAGGSAVQITAIVSFLITFIIIILSSYLDRRKTQGFVQASI